MSARLLRATIPHRHRQTDGGVTILSMPKFAANLSLMFNELGFLERFAAARAAGFDAVEFLFPYACEPEQIIGRLQRYKLQLVLHNFPPGDWAAGVRGFACD